MYKPSAAQFTGCLLGQCLGDALGFVVEGYPPSTCSDYVRGLLRGCKAGTLGRTGIPFGQYTDDSQLARELMESIVEVGRFEPENYARRIAAIFMEERIVGRGRSTEEAALRLARGVSWDSAGAPAPMAGNGSAMRVGPVGLYCHEDADALLRIAHDQGRITHQDPRCSAGAAAIAGAVALALSPSNPDPAVFLSQLAAWAGCYDGSVAETLLRLVDWLRLPPSQAASLISRAGITSGAADGGYSDGWQGISPFVIPSVCWSLYSFLRSPADYWETICTAIEVGGDVDTTAAMAGAISGAHLGIDALPGSLLDRLNDQGTWRRQELEAQAVGLHELRDGRARC